MARTSPGNFEEYKASSSLKTRMTATVTLSLSRYWTGSPTSLLPSIVDMLVETDLRSMMNTSPRPLKSICLAYFDDVREEEVPGFAGKNSRTDFYLKDEARFIEVKMTRDGLRDKELGKGV